MRYTPISDEMITVEPGSMPIGDFGLSAGMPEFSAEPEQFFRDALTGGLFSIGLSDIGLAWSECDVCLNVAGDFLYMDFEGAVFCVRRNTPGCTFEPPPPPPPPPPKKGPPWPDLPRLFAVDRPCIVFIEINGGHNNKSYTSTGAIRYNNTDTYLYDQNLPDSRYQGDSSEWTSTLTYGRWVIPMDAGDYLEWDYSSTATSNLIYNTVYLARYDQYGNSRHLGWQGAWQHIPSGYWTGALPTYHYSRLWKYGRLAQSGDTNIHFTIYTEPPEAPITDGDPKRKTPPPTRDEDDEEMDCCRDVRDIKAMVRKIYRATGAREDFPVQVPQVFNRDENRTISLRSIPEMVLWLSQVIDGLVGSFPVEIEIEDADPLTPQKEKVKLEMGNISEILAELYGLGYVASQTGNTTVNGIIRLASEIIATKNATLHNQGHIKAQSAYLGFKQKNSQQRVGYAFDLDEPNSLSKIFDDVIQKIDFIQFDDEENLAEILQRILVDVELLKVGKVVSPQRAGQVLQRLQDLANNPIWGRGDMDWETFIETLNTEGFVNRTPGSPKPRAENIDL